MTDAPACSLLLPCYNEAPHIARVLGEILAPGQRSRECLVVDGGSGDGTRAIVTRLAATDPRIRLLENPRRLQSVALNTGLEQARGTWVVRIDAHSFYPEGYVDRVVDLLEETGADNAGGGMRPVARKGFARVVAWAMCHPLGVGGARFHREAPFQGWVDTVYLGAFRRQDLLDLGGWDEASWPNEDGELNLRIRRRGGRIWLDNRIRVGYEPRSSWWGLGLQYFRYGQGRAYTTRRWRSFAAPRQALLAGGLPLALLGILAGHLAGYSLAGLLPWGLYASSLLVGATLPAPGHLRVRLPARLCLPPTLAWMHLVWALGFWKGLLAGPGRRF